MTFAVSTSVLAFYALALIVQYGYSYGALALLLLSFVALFQSKQKESLPLNALYFPMLMLLGFFLVQLADIVFHDLTLRFLDKPIRFLLAAFILTLLAKFPPKLSYFWVGIILGAIGSGGFAIYQRYELNIYRAHGYEYFIQFGDICMLFAVLCLAGIIWAKQQNKQWLWIVLFIVGFVLGVEGSLLSLTRGGWLVLPLLIVLYPLCFPSEFSAKKLMLFIFSTLLVLLALYVIPQTKVKIKIDEAISDVSNYQHGNWQTSQGQRLIMWKTAIDLFKQKPIFGWGERSYLEAIKQKVASKELPEKFLEFNHAHNEFIDAMVKRGTIGLLALLILYIGFFIYFFKHTKHQSANVRSTAFAGVLLISSYTTFGLSQGFLSHNSGVMVLAFSLIFIATLMQAALHSTQQNSTSNSSLQ